MSRSASPNETPSFKKSVRFIKLIEEQYPELIDDLLMRNVSGTLFAVDYQKVMKFCRQRGISKFYDCGYDTTYDSLLVGFDYVDWIVDNPEQFDLMLL